MFQSVGLVSGVEGDRDLFAVRIEVSGIDIVGIGRPGIVGSLVEDTERLITDRDRIFEEDIGLGSVKRDLCAVLDRRVRLDRLTVDLQVRTGTDDLVDAAEQCAFRNVEAVAHRDRLFVIDRADIALYALVAVTDLKVVSVARLAEQIYRRQRIAEHIPVVSQQVVDHIVLRQVVFDVETDGLDRRLFALCAQRQPQFFVIVKCGRAQILDDRRLYVFLLRQCRLIHRTLCFRDRSRCRSVGVLDQDRTERTVRIAVLEADRAVGRRIVGTVHVVGHHIDDIFDVAGDLDAAGTGVGHAAAFDLDDLIRCQLCDPLLIEVRQRQIVVPTVLDPEYQCFMCRQDPALIAFPPYAVTAAVRIIVIQLIILEIDVLIGIVVDLNILICVGTVGI